jgi:erythromycin esterase
MTLTSAAAVQTTSPSGWRRWFVYLTLQRLSLATLVAASCVGGAATQADDREVFVRWAASRVTPISDDAIGRVVGNARVVALGEANHGAEEALAFRNQAFRSLVESKEFSAIALETGYAESLRISDYIAGGPGDAADIARTSFTSGFGNLQANVELITWMRDYNRTAPPAKQLRLFGIDLSLGGPMGSSATAAPVECALRSLQRTSRDEAERLRQAFSSGVGRLVSEQREFSPADHAAYDAFARDLETIARRTGDPQAAHCARIVRQAGDVHRVAPNPGPGGIPPDAWRTLEARDTAMADNTVWALEQLQPDRRLLVFAHNAHVMNATRRGGDLSGLAQPPRSMGQRLRDTLGSALVIIAEATPGTSRNPLEFGDILRAAGTAPFLVDLRPASGPVRTWLDRTQPLRANDHSEALVTPARAFDVVVVQARHSPARFSTPAAKAP